MEFMLAAQILAGLWCKWRHGKLWEYRDCRVFPYENFAVTSHYCPRCKGEVLTRKKLTDAEAEAFKPKPKARQMSLEQVMGMRAMSTEELAERNLRMYFPGDIVEAPKSGEDWPDEIPG